MIHSCPWRDVYLRQGFFLFSLPSQLGDTISTAMRLLSTLKNYLVPSGPAARTIQLGPMRGTQFEIDLRSGMQTYLGLSELELHKWFTQLSRGIGTAIDVGAAEGYYSLYFLLKTPAKNVLAFEPMDHSLSKLRRNLEHNGLANSPRFELSTKFVGPRNVQGMVTLDSLVSRVHSPCLIKLDVEGAELEVLSGATSFIRDRDVRWIIEVHSKELRESCDQFLKQQGYQTRQIGNSILRWVIPEQRPAEHNSWIVASRTLP